MTMNYQPQKASELSVRKPGRGRPKGRLNNHPKLPVRSMDVLRFIVEYSVKYHMPPSVREIGSGTGISSTSVVNYYIERLVAFGLLERTPRISRGILLTDQGRNEIGVHQKIVVITCPHCNKPFDAPADGVELVDDPAKGLITQVKKYRPKNVTVAA